MCAVEPPCNTYNPAKSLPAAIAKSGIKAAGKVRVDRSVPLKPEMALREPSPSGGVPMSKNPLVVEKPPFFESM